MYYLVYILPLLLYLGLQWGGIYIYSVLILVFLFVPLADTLIGRLKNYSPPLSSQAVDKFLYDWPLYLFVPIQWLMLFWGADTLNTKLLTFPEKLGLLLSTSIITGAGGITIAHELIHRRKWARILGQAILLPVGYLHFSLEHIIGHHVYVGTPVDSATARHGESVYSFLPRSVLGGWIHSWKFEVQRLKGKGRNHWQLQNRMVIYSLYTLGLVFLIGLLFGLPGILFFILQSALSISLLEVINYIEHYGLERKETKPMHYEKVSSAHSWNSGNTVSNTLLFQLPKHSEHHLHPERHYQFLQEDPQGPQLPFGYPVMILLAFIPPLWRKIMDPRLASLTTPPLGHDKGVHFLSGVGTLSSADNHQ